MATGQVLLISSGIFVYLSWYAYRQVGSGIRYDLFYGSVDALSNEARAELFHRVLVHLREHKLVIVQLSADLLPEMGLASPEGFSDVGSIGSVVADEIGVKFTGDCSREPPDHENWEKDSQTDEVVADGGVLPSINEPCISYFLPKIHLFKNQAGKMVTKGMAAVFMVS